MRLKRAEQHFKLTTEDYARLAEFRSILRGFLGFSEAAAAEVGLTARHYQALLVLRSCKQNGEVTISDLAQQLSIKHNSAVGLVDRLAQENMVVRETSAIDRRKVDLHLTTRGRQVLAQLAATHQRQLQRIGPIMKRFFGEIVRTKRGAGR